jgi:hypothetical protein
VATLNGTGSALVYSTYLGGSERDWITEVALDPSGNAYTVGVTLSPDFPVSIGAFETSHKGKMGLFVTKVDRAGALIYSTFLRGSDHDGGCYDFYFEHGIAVDVQGNAFVTGYIQSKDYPVTAGAFQTTLKVADAFVTKLNASGTGLVYSTLLGGARDDGGFGITVDSAGNAYVAGATRSFDFPTVNPFQEANSSVPMIRSSDGGNKWSEVELPNVSIVSLSFAPNDSRKIFAGLDKKLWVSEDGGQKWWATGLSGTRTYQLEFDRMNPKNVYARTFYHEIETGSHGAVYKSIDGGDSWSPTSLSGAFFTKIVVHPKSPSTVFASSHRYRVNSLNGVFRINDGGQTWTPINGGLSPDERQVSSLAMDPTNSSIIYIGTLRGVFKSIDGGQNWSKTSIGDAVLALEMDPSNPSTLYASIDEFEGNVTLTLDDPNGRVNPRRRFLGSASNKYDAQEPEYGLMSKKAGRNASRVER